MARTTGNSKLEKKIDDLAVATKEGFKASDKRIDDLAAVTKDGFDTVDKRFGKVGERLNQHDKMFTQVATKQDLKELENKFVTKDEFDRKTDKIIAIIDGLAKSVSDFQAELASNVFAHDRFESRFILIEKRIDKVEARTVKRK